VASHCKVQELSAISCAKMAKPIEMQFGMLRRVGPWNHVLHGGAGDPTVRSTFCGLANCKAQVLRVG